MDKKLFFIFFSKMVILSIWGLDSSLLSKSLSRILEFGTTFHIFCENILSVIQKHVIQNLHIWYFLMLRHFWTLENLDFWDVLDENNRWILKVRHGVLQNLCWWNKWLWFYGSRKKLYVFELRIIFQTFDWMQFFDVLIIFLKIWLKRTVFLTHEEKIWFQVILGC